MKASELNRLYGEYAAAPGHLPLSAVLEAVREHVAEKFYRDVDKKDIAQECVTKVWRSIDPGAKNPLKPFNQKQSSFSTWLSIICSTVRSNHHRDQGLNETAKDNERLERLEFEHEDPWHSEGRRWVRARPPEHFYYEKPDPKCQIPLGKSAWAEN